MPRRPQPPPLDRERILAHLSSAGYGASSARDLMRQIPVSRDQKDEFVRLLRQLVEEGTIRRLSGNRYRLPRVKGLATGRFVAHRDGYGFVEREQDEGPDIYVRRRHIGGALHGDRVRVQVTLGGGGGKPEGRILRVLERAGHRLTCILGQRGTVLFATPYGSAPYAEVAIPTAAAGGAEPGMVVGVELIRLPPEGEIPEGRVVERLGLPEDPGMDLRIIIRKYGLRDEFPPGVREAARTAPTSVGLEEIAGREDFRDITTVTIDGETARDFDDAVSIRREPGGGFTLWVHVADVSHYVREGSLLDQEAQQRGTSVYFPERAVHMLPEELSTGICSLNPGVDRLCQTCVMELGPDGDVRRHRIVKGVIRSYRRLTYTSVAKALEGDREEAERHADLLDTFQVMRELCLILRARRRARGSIDFDLPEPVILLDERGEMTGITPLARNPAHQIIEEFMLAANETVATFLADQEWPALYRIHEKPDPARLEALDEVVRTFGYSLPQPYEEITPKDIQKFLSAIEGRPEAGALQRIVLQSLMRARYSETLGLHFGLATRRYLHFTSPIRRYPDLIVHRTLSDAALWRTASEVRRRERRHELRVLAEHCSERERNADAAEWELIDWKKITFMADRIGEEHDAIVSGVVSFGLFVELEDLFIDGLVHISTLSDDFYRFVESKHLLIGERTGRRFKLGDTVRVVVERVDALMKRIDFRLAGSSERPRR